MDEPSGAWMTKAELAHVRGISVASAYRLIRRQGWRRQPGNDGKVRVFVPSDWSEPREADRADVSTDRPLTNPSDTDWLVRLIDAANVRADEANKRADAALALVADANARADRAEAEASGQRIAAEVARAAMERARADAREAQDAAEALRQADAARRARGRWARLRAAWKGA